MSTTAAEAPVLEVEERGIQRVPPEDRTDRNVSGLGFLWFTVNFVLSSVVTGALSITLFKMGLWDSLLAVVVFNVLGIFPVAFLCTQGPRLGLRQMTISRFSFGWNGAKVTALFNVAACLGWSTVNVIIGAGLFSAVTGWPFWFGILVIAAATTIVSIYGYHLVHRYEQYAWIPLAAVFIVMAVVAGPHVHTIPTPALSLGYVASVMSFGGAIFGFAVGWSSYASDYSAYLPESTPARSVFWWTFAGEFLATVLLEGLGVLLATWLPNAFGSDILVGAVHPLGNIWGNLVLLFFVASVIANNIPNDYSLGLTVQVLGRWWEGVPRWLWTLIGAVIYTVAALLLGSNVTGTLEGFLLLVAYWLGAWSTILILEDVVFRKGKYNVREWDQRRSLPTGWAAMIAFVLGLVGVVLGASQEKFTGPVARAFKGMDLGFELAVLFALVAYLLLRPVEMRRTRR